MNFILGATCGQDLVDITTKLAGNYKVQIRKEVEEQTKPTLQIDWVFQKRN